MNTTETQFNPSAKESFDFLKALYGISADISDENALATLVEQLCKTGMPALVDTNTALSYVLAAYYEDVWRNQSFRKAEPFDLIKAIKYWGYAGYPERSVEISNETNALEQWSPKERSAFFTTRGAAFRKMGNLKQALEDADKAIAILSNIHHPFNLKGAVNIELGEYELGEQAFERARKLAPPSLKRNVIAFQRRDLESIFRKIDVQRKVELANRLLNEDPQQFRWVIPILKEAESLLAYEKEKQESQEEIDSIMRQMERSIAYEEEIMREMEDASEVSLEDLDLFLNYKADEPLMTRRADLERQSKDYDYSNSPIDWLDFEE